MRLRKNIAVFMAAILMFFISVNSIDVSAAEVPTITASASNEGNYVHLNWTSPNADKYYSYMLRSKESSGSIFQSIPSKEKVKVLNVYPGKGDNLKTWMETNGYGKGLISVDKVDIDAFSASTNSYLKDTSGEWKYDVIVFGFYDANGGKDISKESADIVEQFIKAGRGVLFGHDTMIPSARPNIASLAKYINMDATGAPNYSMSTKVTISKKGLLTNYPWSIGDVGTVLTIPETHIYHQLPSGEVWMKLTSDNQFYLTSWNNTAMIQTGHSNGTATDDEQKVLANTIFYLAQVTENLSWDDHKGQDLAAPAKPNITAVNYNPTDKKVTMKFDECKDMGSTYSYYVEATEKGTGTVTKSEVTSATVTTGIKGYSIVVDKNPNTVPDCKELVKDNLYTLNKDFNSDFYVHVAAVDNAGNVSEVAHYKYTFPVLNLSASDLDKDTNTVKITAQGQSDVSSVTKIVLPNGEAVDSNTCEYTAASNGTYEFTAIDKEGNEVKESIKINTIPTNILLDDVKVNEDNNSTSLNWTVSDKTQDYTYNVNSKKSDESDFTSVSVKDNSYIDAEGKDVSAPTRPDITKVDINKEDNTTSIKFNESADKGTGYDYNVEAVASETGIKSTSETKSATVTSGLKGYSVVVDNTPNTIPKAVVTTTSTEYVFDKILEGTFYVHVAAVDNAGNISEVSTYKYSYPTLSLTENTTEDVRDSITITAKASSEDYGIAKVITPDGKTVESASTEYTVTENGTYTFTAVDKEGHKTTSSIEVKNILPPVVLNVEPNFKNFYLNETVVVDLTMDNITDIAAEDIRVKYDSSKLEFTGFNKADGIIPVKTSVKDGEIRFIFASKGVANVVNAKTVLAKLYFKPKAGGDAVIDVTKGRVSDGIAMEKDLRDAECGETTINIVNKNFLSVDPDSEDFTLLDLAIIARHYGEDPASLRPEYETDALIDGNINDDDLTKVADLMLKNPNYKF